MRQIRIRHMKLACGLLALAAIWAWAAQAGAAASDSTPVEKPVAAHAATADSGDTDPRIAQLIQQLGDRRFAQRERAQAELAKLGVAVFDALTQAENNEDIEIASRAHYLVRQIRINLAHESDPESVKRFFKEYESLDFNGRLDGINKLVALPQAAGLGPACRLVRFERSAILSKRVALAIMGMWFPWDGWQPRAKVIADNLDKCNRPGAIWLQTFVREHESVEAADAAAASWDKLVAEELKVAEQSPQQEENAVAALLVQHQAEFLRRSKHPEAALAAARRVVELKQADAGALPTLVDWLIRQQAWPVIDEVSRRFERAFKSDASLLYCLAQARQAQGKPALAAPLADEAFALAGDDLQTHFTAAQLLKQRGCFTWAEREYRRIIEISGPKSDNHIVGVKVRTILSEMLHDEEEDAHAADVLKELIALMDRDKTVEEDVKKSQDPNSNESAPAAIRSRYHFFLSCRPGTDAEKQAAELWEAIEINPLDADVLIGLYRLPRLSAADHQRVSNLIKTAGAEFRKEIDLSPGQASDDPFGGSATIDATPYNQFAWLIGNTEGDYDEAIRMSLRSLELDPGAAGYLDTLAHCYFTAGQLESAVRCQAEAAELEPHSKPIVKAYEQFRQAAEKAKAEPSKANGK